MTIVDRPFINVTGSPAVGRDARRIHIRSTVMSNYHKRRAQKKKHTKLRNSLPLGTFDSSSQRAAKPSPRHATSVLPDSTTSSVQVTSDTAVSLPAPPLAAASPSGLFSPKNFDNPDHTHMSRIMVRFLCGQVKKAVQGLSHVSFVHRKIVETEAGQSQNPLVVCRDVLRSDYDANTLHSPALWEKIDAAQEDTYLQVRSSCISCRGPTPFPITREPGE